MSTTDLQKNIILAESVESWSRSAGMVAGNMAESGSKLPQSNSERGRFEMRRIMLALVMTLAVGSAHARFLLMNQPSGIVKVNGEPLPATAVQVRFVDSAEKNGFGRTTDAPR